MRTLSIFSTKLPPARADLFPACKHFFPCTEQAGASTLTDVIGGCEMWLGVGGFGTPPAQGPRQYISKPDAHSIAVPLNSDNQALVRGAIVSPGNKTITVLCVADAGQFAYFGWGYSGTGIQEIMVIANTVWPNIKDGTNTCNATPCTDPGAGVVYAFGCTFDFGGNAVSFQTDAAGVYSANAPVAMGAVANVSNLPAAASLSGADGSYKMTALYGSALFIWEGSPPSDFAVAIPWMLSAWKNGTKTIYPGWIGKR